MDGKDFSSNTEWQMHFQKVGLSLQTKRELLKQKCSGTVNETRGIQKTVN